MRERRLTKLRLMRAGPGGMTSAADAKGQATKVGGGNEVRHELMDGDYQIIIHVIEARDLEPVDKENGTADPVVLAKLEFPSSIVPMYQNTDRKVNTLNPVWDYTMIFRETGLPVRERPARAHRHMPAAEGRAAHHLTVHPTAAQASEAKMGILSIMVKDANITQRDVMIGQARRPTPRTSPARPLAPPVTALPCPAPALPCLPLPCPAPGLALPSCDQACPPGARRPTRAARPSPAQFDPAPALAIAPHPYHAV